MLAKGVPAVAQRKRQLHLMMGENFGRLGQWANATDSYGKARAVRDDRDAHFLSITALSNNQAAKPAQMLSLIHI